MENGLDYIEAFLNYLRHELAYSTLTVDAYRRDLEQWAIHATAGKPSQLSPPDITRSDLRLWIASLGAKGIKPQSVKRKISALRAFFRFLHKQGEININPASRLTMPATPSRLPVNVRTHEMLAVLEHGTQAAQSSGADDEGDGDIANDDGDPHTLARNRLIVELLYATGMRCSELVGLRDADTDTHRGELKVLGKRNKERVIPLGPGTAAAIDRYRTLRDSNPATTIDPRDPAAPLLVRLGAKPLYRRLVYRVVHDTLQRAGVHATRLSPHVLRHTMATDMLNAGAPLPTVQQLLGHASLTSTQIYTHLSYRDLKNNYQQAHPRAANDKGGQQHGH